MREMRLIAADLVKHTGPKNHLGRSNDIPADPAPVCEPLMTWPDDPAADGCACDRAMAVGEVDRKAVDQADSGIRLHQRGRSGQASWCQQVIGRQEGGVIAGYLGDSLVIGRDVAHIRRVADRAYAGIIRGELADDSVAAIR